MKPLGDIKQSSSCPLMLGTVQFGLNYGIANTRGKPSYETSRSIVQCAYEGGVDCLDTAAAYGDSENVVGKILDDLDIRNKICVVTKVRALPGDIPTNDISKWVENNIQNSLKNLRTDVLPCVLLHNESDFEKAFEYLEIAREKGQVLGVGVSGGSSPKITSQAVASGRMQTLQVPTNLYDRRFRRSSGIIESASAQGITIFTRSVYLQGLAVMPIEQIAEKPYFAKFLSIRQKIDEIAKQAGLNLCELSMRYVLSLQYVTRLLVGVDTQRQMQENLDIASGGPLTPDLLQAIDNAIPELPDDIINPVNWTKR